MVDYLFIKVKKTFWTVNIMKLSKRYDGAINVHWMSTQSTTGCHKQPIRIRAADENLKKTIYKRVKIMKTTTITTITQCPEYSYWL